MRVRPPVTSSATNRPTRSLPAAAARVPCSDCSDLATSPRPGPRQCKISRRVAASAFVSHDTHTNLHPEVLSGPLPLSPGQSHASAAIASDSASSPTPLPLPYSRGVAVSTLLSCRHLLLAWLFSPPRASRASPNSLQTTARNEVDRHAHVKSIAVLASPPTFDISEFRRISFTRPSPLPAQHMLLRPA